jgi:quaternary ammonium compound-resistance protein SugE
VTSAWTYLIAAGLFEIGWPIGLKWAQEATQLRGTFLGIVVAVVSMAVSGALLYLAQREIASELPMQCGPASALPARS